VPQDSAFRRLDEAGAQPAAAPVVLEFEGAPLSARAGDSVAAALLAAGHLTLRTTPASGAPRGPFCMMGACFDCLVEIDGEPNRQACMTPVAPGMKVRRMQGARPLPAGGAGEG
jgi:predicted molibdopterin-dependent oxidoreductase YjgC